MRTPDCMFEMAPEYICTKSMSNHWMMLGSKDRDDYRPKVFDIDADRPLFLDGGINLMVKCGQAIEDGFLLIIDVDEHEGQPSGLRTISELEDKHGALPETVEVRTPSGGKHYWFKTREPIGRVGKIGASVEFYGKNYVMTPFSRKKIGVYEVIDKDAELAWAPDWLLDLIDAGVKPFFDATEQFDGLPTHVTDGGRTAALGLAAYRFRAAGISEPSLFFSLLDTYNQQCFYPPVSMEKIKGFRSYLSYPIETTPEPLKPEAAQTPHDNGPSKLETELKQALSGAKGLVKDIADSILEGSIVKIDQFALASALGIIGGVAQGSYTLPNLKNKSLVGRPLSLYNWLHGASACGKNSYISAVSRYLDNVSELISCDEPSSDYGLRIELYSFNSRVMIIDEIQDVLDGWSSPTNPAHRVLKDMKLLMNGEPYLKGKVAKTGGLMRVNMPILSTFFAGTTEGFLRQLSGTNVGGGLMSRFVVWPAIDDSGYDVETSLEIKDTQIDALAKIFKRGLTIELDKHDQIEIKNRAKGYGNPCVTIPSHIPQTNPLKMSLSPAAKLSYREYFAEKRKLYKVLRRDSQAEKDMSPGSIAARAPMLAYTYAGIHALGRGGTTLEVDDMQWAIALMEALSGYLSDSIVNYGGDDAFDMICNRAYVNLSKVLNKDQPFTRKILRGKISSNHIDRVTVDKILLTLALKRKIRVTDHDGADVNFDFLEDPRSKNKAQFRLI